VALLLLLGGVELNTGPKTPRDALPLGVLDVRSARLFVTQRRSDPGIQRSGDPVDPVILFYSELQMSTYVYGCANQAFYCSSTLLSILSITGVLDKVSK